MGFRGNARYVEKKIFGTGGAKRRYGIGKGKGGFKLAKLAADLEMVKNRLNVEKKHKDADVSTNTVGQVNQNNEGALYLDVTPSIAQGTDSDERVGNSLKLTGMTLPIQFAQQINTLGDRKVRISLIRCRAADNGTTRFEAAEQIWDVNPLTGVRDYDSPRAYRNSKQDGLSILRQMTCYIKGPALETGSTGAIGNREMNVKNIRFSVKLQDILRYASSGDALPDGIRYYLVIQADAGNKSGTNSTLDVPVTDNSSGLQVRVAQRNWWVDN